MLTRHQQTTKTKTPASDLENTPRVATYSSITTALLLIMVDLLHYLKSVASLKETLLSELNPYELMSLRYALGRNPFTDLERFKYVSIIPLLGINGNHILRMNELGYTVTIIGKELKTLNDMLCEAILPQSSVFYTSAFVFCSRTSEAEGGHHASTSMMERGLVNANSIIDPLVIGAKESWIDNVFLFNYGVQTTLTVGDQSSRGAGSWMSPSITRHTLNLPTVGQHNHFSTDYMWINFRTCPEIMPTIRTGVSDQVLDVAEDLPLDYTVHDDDDTSRIEFHTIMRAGGAWPSLSDGLIMSNLRGRILRTRRRTCARVVSIARK